MFRRHDNAGTLAHEAASKLCEKYFDHQYPIGRKDAQEVLNLNVEHMSEDLWQRTSELMLAYDKMLESQNIAIILETSEAFDITHWPKSS